MPVQDLTNYKDFIHTHNFQTIRCKSCGYVHCVPIYCGNRFCEICSRPRMLRVKMRLTDLMNLLTLDRGQYFSHLVLTIRSQENVKEMCSTLVRNFKRFRKLSIFRKNTMGGAYVLEVTHQDAGWHVHIHAIIQNYFVPQSELLSAWNKIVDHGSVFIKSIPKKAIINYLSKYMTKVTLTGILKEEAGAALKGLRLFTVFGSWHKLLPHWTKIPFECPDCGSVMWTLAHELSIEEGIYVDDQKTQRYG